MYFNYTSSQRLWRIQITYLRDSRQTQAEKRRFCIKLLIKMKSLHNLCVLLYKHRLDNAQCPKNTQNIHKIGGMTKTISLDSKHNNPKQYHSFWVASTTSTLIGTTYFYFFDQTEFLVMKVMPVPIFNSGWRHRQQSQRPPPWWRSPHGTPAHDWSKQFKR